MSEPKFCGACQKQDFCCVCPDAEEKLENEIIMTLRHFSENDMHDYSTGTQRMIVRDIIRKVRKFNER